MATIKQTLEQLIAPALCSASGVEQCQANVILTSRPEFGDYQANGVMSVARQLKTNPRELAQKVVEQIPDTDMIQKLEIAGPGFINIHLSTEWLQQQAAILQNNIAKLLPSVDTPETIVVDYSSPNLAKEMHVGHLRGTIIGDSIARVLEQLGNKVVRQNHVGDWGTQFGMLIAYMQKLSVNGEVVSTQLSDLESFYRAAKEQFDSDAEFADTARASVVKLQSGDPAYTSIWEQFIEESLKHCEAVYAKLGITLARNDLRPESFYNKDLGDIVSVLDDKGLLTVSDGARCVFLPEFVGKDGGPLPVIVQKSDGGYLYSTTDLAAIRFRSSELKAQRVLYVVDARQSLHFQQVFAVATKAGLVDKDCSLEHIAYGTMMGADGKPFKTRSGGTTKLVELLDEAQRRAYDLVSEKNPDLDEATKKNVARVVGISAVKYADLSKNRTSDYIFDWSTMLSFEGNTAPYLLYAYARIKSILRRDSDNKDPEKEIRLEAAEERALAMKIVQLPDTILLVANDCYPNHLCTYLYELAGIFMRFYEACPILKADEGTKKSRLALATLTALTLQTGLDLLGIETLEQM